MKGGRDRLVIGLAGGVAAMTIAQQIASKSLRDGFFLAEFEVTALPYAVVGGAMVSFVAAVALGRLMGLLTPAIAVPVIFGVNALAFFCESVFITHAPAAVAAVLYLHTAAFGGAVVSGFWSVINERFDPYAARRAMGRIAGGATVGGMLGGALTWVFADLTRPALLQSLGVANVLCGVLLTRVAAGSSKGSRGSSTALTGGFRTLLSSAYPRSIALLVFFLALMASTVDYVFKAGVQEASGESLVGFFAMFYTATGVLTFLVQAGGSRRVLTRFGIVPAIAALPITALALLCVALVVPMLATLIVLRGAMMVVENSLYRSGYELLYTSVPKAQKRSAKLLIDLGSDRLGTAAGSGLALVSIAIASSASDRLLLLAAAALAVIALAILSVVRREYIASLAQQIRASIVPNAGPDRWVALASTFVGGGEELAFSRSESSQGQTKSAPINYDALMDEVERLAKAKRARSAPSASAHAEAAGVSERMLETPVRRLLQGTDGEDDAWHELRRSAPGIVGQLTDVLLSDRNAVDERVFAAALLATVPGERSVTGLLRGLRSHAFRVRRASAIALVLVSEQRPTLSVPKRRLAELAGKELRRPARPNEAITAFEASSPFRFDARGNTIASTLELVLLLLAIGGDGEALRLALSAVTSPDRTQRGTGLEYLDNLLPGNLRSRLVGLVEAPERTRATLRVPRQVVHRLAEDLRARRVTVRQLRARFAAEKHALYETEGDAI